MKQHKLNDNSTLQCIYCSGPLKPISLKSYSFQYLQCINCDRLQCIFKTDYLEFLGYRQFDPETGSSRVPFFPTLQQVPAGSPVK